MAPVLVPGWEWGELCLKDAPGREKRLLVQERGGVASVLVLE